MSGWQNHKESQEGEVHSEKKKNDQTVDLEILSIPQKPLSSLLWDMWVFVIKGRLFPMVPMIPTPGRLFGMVGDGVLFKANREKYIPSFVRGKQDLVAYGLSLTDQQKAAIQSAFSGDRRPVNSLGTKLAVDERREERVSIPTLPTKRARCDPPINSSSSESLRPTLFSVPIVSCWQTLSWEKLELIY